MNICRNGHELTESNIYSLRKRDGRIHKLCKTCKRLNRKRYHKIHRNSSNRKSASWKKAALNDGKCSNCATVGVSSPESVYCIRCLERKKVYRQNIKIDVIKLYGGCCNRCGIRNIDFLTIHHKNNDGNIERVATKNHGGSSFYKRLLMLEKRRSDLELLCFNCNLRIHRMNSKDTTASRCNLRTKIKLLSLYGDHCNYCGEKDPLVLCVDHINNNGKLDRMQFGTSTAFYRHLLKIKPRKDIQILCLNCNESKRIQNNHHNHHIHVEGL